MRTQLILLFTTFLLSSFALTASNSTEDPCQYDNTNPVAVCDYHTVVSLGSNGVGALYATSVDDGSYDNCGIASYQVRRMTQGWCAPGVDDDTYFGPYVEFCCEDLFGGPQWVVLRVTDYKGNYNECMVQVTIQDYNEPYFSCPPDIVISCGFWFNENDLYNPYSHTFGTIVTNPWEQQPIIINDPGNTWYQQPYNWGYDGLAGAGGGCSGQQQAWINITEVLDYRNACGVGVIKRKFEIELGGWTDWCYQTITVKDFSYSNNYIDWPDDYTVNDCMTNPDHYGPNNLPPPYNKPNVGAGGSCSLIGVAHEDLVFTFADGACYKILRKWTVIDWCKYNPNYPWSGGIWTHTQIIKIMNNKAPEFVNGCHDIVVEGFETQCAGRYTRTYDVMDDCTPDNHLTYDYKIDLYNNGSYDIYGEGSGEPHVDKVLPLGWHKILVTTSDQCGNHKSCSHKIHVIDKKKPTPVCINGLSSVVMPIGGMVTIWAKDFNISSYDNCTPEYALKYSFSSDVTETSFNFTCDHIGTNSVQIWVTDQYGNQQYCTTYIKIDDNEGVCESGNIVEGRVQSYSEVPIPNVKVDLYKIMPDESLKSDKNTKVTNELGLFSTGFGTTAYNRQIMATRTGDEKAGISTLDLVALQRHILGLETFTRPEQFLAADLDGSGHVGVMDLIMLRNVLLGAPVGPNTQINTGWYFFDENCSWEQPADIFTSTCDNSHFVSQTGNFPMPVNFYAIKMGDINDDLTNSGWHIETRAENDFELILKMDALDENIVHLTASNDITTFGSQFSLPLPTTGFELIDGLISMDGNSVYLDEQNDIMNISWGRKEVLEIAEGEVLFSIKIEEQVGQWLKKASYNALTTGLIPEIYNDQKLALDVIFTEVVLEDQELPEIDEFEIWVTPNPFSNQTKLLITSPEYYSDATLEVFNEVGQRVTNKVIEITKGMNQIELDQNDMTTAGIYYYKLQLNKEFHSGKLMKL